MHISYKVQPSPDGLAQAFILGEEYIAGDTCAMILGDNIFFGTGFSPMLKKASCIVEGAEVFACLVKDPERFGVIAFDKDKKAISIDEKPLQPRSNWAVTGLYFYDNHVSEYAKNLKPSIRGELEITDLNRIYMEQGKLSVNLLGRGFAWLDTGTNDSLLEAGEFVATIQKRQGNMIACLEEIAFHNGWIDAETVVEAAKTLEKTEYGRYLMDLLL
jgi:glucose-1-phosphate thymidylyltransferase